MSLLVEDVMVKDVITINHGYPVKYAESLMKYFGVGCLVVLKDREPTGMITRRDIETKVNNTPEDPLITMVEEVMSEPLLWVSPKTPLTEAVDIMLDKDIQRLPVISNLSRGPTLLGLLERMELEGEYPELAEVAPTL
jgi:CBS domain-containing protein